jgi:hypothetical protein
LQIPSFLWRILNHFLDNVGACIATVQLFGTWQRRSSLMHNGPVHGGWPVRSMRQKCRSRKSVPQCLLPQGSDFVSYANPVRRNEAELTGQIKI